VVIADEAHRSQYGFKAKEIDVKDEQGNVVGKRTAYGFAKYVRDALPKSHVKGSVYVDIVPQIVAICQVCCLLIPDFRLNPNFNTKS